MPKQIKPPAPPVVGGIPANHSGEGNHPVTRVVIHSAVMPCEAGRARQLARMNQDPKHTGSWHYAVDPFETIQCSFDRFICWHAPPNFRSIGIEMADWPAPWPQGVRTKRWWTKLWRSWRWSRRNHKLMLKRTAKLTAHLCLAYDLPLEFLSPKQLRRGHKGITTHANVSKAFQQSTHWDPGSWPRRKFMRLVRRYADEIRDS